MGLQKMWPKEDACPRCQTGGQSTLNSLEAKVLIPVYSLSRETPLDSQETLLLSVSPFPPLTAQKQINYHSRSQPQASNL